MAEPTPGATRRRLGSWIDRTWAVVATTVLIVTIVVSLYVSIALGDRMLTAEYVGLLVAAVIGIWTIEHLRRDFVETHRPYIAIGKNSVSLPNGEGVFGLTLHICNFGRSPGIIIRECTLHTLDGEDHHLPPGKTERNIIYPGEDVTTCYRTKAGSRLLWRCWYEDLSGRHRYEFSIHYDVEAQDSIAIVRKTAN